MNEDIFISDFGCAKPDSAWTNQDATLFQPAAKVSTDTWRLIDYKTQNFNGRMLQTSHPDAPVLSVELNGEGWHAISIGLSDRTHGASVIEIRLSNMERWQTLFAFDGPLHEDPWIFADITDCHLEIRYPQDLKQLPVGISPLMNLSARIFSIRCAPMKDEHVQALKADTHHPLAYTNDGFGIFFSAEKPGKHNIDDALNHFKDSDFDICCFSPGGPGALNYDSQYGNRCAEAGWDFPRSGDGNLKAMIEGTLALGIDPLQQAVTTAHANGQQVWTYLRPQLWSGDPVHDHVFRSTFFQEHPECRCMEADGTPDSKLSIAFPEVRAVHAGLIEEALERGADGICLALVRGYPMVRYEQPVRDRYKEQFGMDPICLPDTDPTLQVIWAEFMTEWLAEIRKQLDAAGPSEKADRRKLSVIVGSDTRWNAMFGFDVRGWAQQGLIDAVMPYWKGNEDKPGWIDVAEYAAILKDTKTQLLPNIGSCFDHKMTLAAIRKRANAWYKAGAQGLSRWDARGYLAHLKLDSPVQQALWCDHYMGEQEIELTEIAGITLLYFGPGLAT